jgi:phospho-N-acetylmuramoyl-pentapeptide-transferase
LVALAVAALVANPVYRWLLAAKSRQNVSQHLPEHAAKQGTPTMGGIIVLVGGAAGMIAAGASWSALVLLFGFAVVGFVDDFVVPRRSPGSRGLSWIPKLAFQAAVAAIAAVMTTSDPIWIGIIGFLVLFFANAYNFADGMDGMAGGLLAIVALGLAAIAHFHGAASQVWPVILPLAVAAIPFLFLNSPPAKVFMGDVGALPIGAVIGWCIAQTAMQAQPSGASLAPLGVLSLVLFAELVPVPLQIGWVKLTGKRMFSFKTPIHHGFQAAGWPETKIVALFLLVQAGLVVLAVAVCVWGRAS